jgi:hypothetical protein
MLADLNAHGSEAHRKPAQTAGRSGAGAIIAVSCRAVSPE